ncbi:MAG: hypothetical protein NTY15_14125 [Planctomycetota bacterium]|nr:hypothetical protein [Planctomycetota bacterium]
MKSFRKTLIMILFVAAAYAIILPVASAQMIGNRTLGAPALSLQQQRAGTAPTTNAPGGTTIGAASGLQGANARYLRGNRSRQDFVGSNRTDLSGFVGSGQAIGVGRVPTAAETLKLETTKADRINRPLPPQPAKGMYYPRLSLDSDSETSNELPSIGPASPAATERIVEFSKGRANVSMAGTTAVLRGTVSSSREAELLAQLLSFEPGIDRVKNELVVK